MRLRYVYIEKYKDIIEDLNINLGGGYNYTYKNNHINKEPVLDYVDDFYRDYKPIDEITAIIGKNSSGKTTILRLINDIMGGQSVEFNYIAIYEIKGRLYYTSNISNIDVDKIEYVDIQKSKVYEKIGIIFFSSIFDKSSCLTNNNKLIDISTNKILRTYIEDYYYDEITNALKDDAKIIGDRLIREKYLDNDVIDNFKKVEILKTINYLSTINNISEDIKFNSLIGLPKYLRISLGYKRIEKEEMLLKVKNRNKEAYFYLKQVDDAIDDIIENFVEDNIQQYKNEFLAMLVFEIFYWLIYEDQRDINYIIEKYIQDVYSMESLNMEKVLVDIINSILLQDIYDIKMYNEDKPTNGDEQIYNYYEDINYINFNYEIVKIYEEFNSIASRIDEINPNEFIENIEHFIIELNDLLELFNNEEISDDLNYINNEIENIKKNIYDYELYIEDIVSNFNKTISKLYNYIDDETEYKHFSDNEVFEIENTYDIGYENIYKQNIEDDYEYIEQDLKDFIEGIQELIELHFALLSNSDVFRDEEDILYLQTLYSSKDVIKFIEKFNYFNFSTFYLSYDHENLSSGQNAYLDMIIRLVDIKERVDKYDNIIFLVDEGDINLHPDIQIELIQNLCEFLDLFYTDKKFHIIFTSNSPYILSDIINTNIVYLEKITKIENTYKNIKKIRTFGSNVNDLLINSFFMNSIVGSFATKKINKLIRDLSDKNSKNTDKEYIRKNIEQIGDDLIRNKLLEMYTDKFGKDNKDIDREIQFYERKIALLKGMKK